MTLLGYNLSLEPWKFFLNRKKIRKQFRFYCKLFSDVFRLFFQIFFRPPSASILFAIGEPASIGGTEFQANKWAEYLTKRGQKILVFTIGQIKNKKSHTFLNRLKEHRIRYLDLGNLPLAKSLLLQKYTAYLLKQSGAPTLQIFNPLCAPLINPAKKAGMKIIYYETGLPTRDRWWDPLVPNIPWIDQVLAVSNASLKQFCSRFHYQGPGAVFFPLIDPPSETNSKRKCNSGLYRNNLKNRFLSASALPHNFRSHSRLGLGQWSLAPNKNFEEPSCQIPDPSSYFGISCYSSSVNSFKRSSKILVNRSI